jgi:hypothetical protein
MNVNKIASEKVTCPKCNGEGFEGVEQETGCRFSCYFCGETGRVSAEAANDWQREATDYSERHIDFADARADNDSQQDNYYFDDDLPLPASAPVVLTPGTVISIRYRAVDGFSKRGTFKTLAGARKFAQRFIGQTPEIGGTYAVSTDGVGTIHVSGIRLADLFPNA